MSREGYVNIPGNLNQYVRFSNLPPKDPNRPTRQSRKTPNEISAALEGYTTVQQNELCRLPVRTWLKYTNNITGKYRSGGFVVRTGPNWIAFRNPNTGFTWTSTISENTFYRRDPLVLAREKALEERDNELKKRKGKQISTSSSPVSSSSPISSSTLIRKIPTKQTSSTKPSKAILSAAKRLDDEGF